MGKKPVVVVVGLIWAGMALVGCENCKNCRKKYDPAPTFGAKADAPVVKQDATPTPSVVTPTATAGGAPAKPETAKAVDPLGTQGFEKPAAGTPTSAGSTPSPTIQSSLSPKPDASPALPGQAPEYRSGETPISKSVPSNSGFHMPPPPLSQVGASVPSSVAEPLPPISDHSALPRSPLSPSGLTQPPTSTPPLSQPPLTPAPLPPDSGNNMPAPYSFPK